MAIAVVAGDNPAVSWIALFAVSHLLLLGQGDWSKVQTILGGGGEKTPEGTRFVRYRTDLQVQNSSGALIPAQMGLTATAAFSGDPGNCVVDGEFCVAHDEIAPVIDDLRRGGFSVERLVDRFYGEPAVSAISFHGQGKAENMAATLKVAMGEFGKDRLVREGLQRNGRVPEVDWNNVSALLGSPIEKIGDSQVMRAQVDGRTWLTFGGCPCGRTMMFMHLELDAPRLQSTIDRIRAVRFDLTAIYPVGGGHYVVEAASDGNAERLATAASSVMKGR